MSLLSYIGISLRLISVSSSSLGALNAGSTLAVYCVTFPPMYVILTVLLLLDAGTETLLILIVYLVNSPSVAEHTIASSVPNPITKTELTLAKMLDISFVTVAFPEEKLITSVIV